MSSKRFLPLYRDVNREILSKLPAEANFGLVYNKFPDDWDENFRDFDKNRWLSSFISSRTSKPASFMNHLLAETRLRNEKLADAHAGKVFELATASRLVTGMGLSHPVENGFTWHYTLGVPYIPGTTLKGLTRSWVEQWLSDEESLLHAFGSDSSDMPASQHRPNQTGDLIFLDSLPSASPSLEVEYMTPHYSDYYQGNEPPADWQSPKPIPFLTVAAGAAFQFVILSRNRDRSMVQKGVKWLAEALTTIGVGAKSSSGYGLFRPWNVDSPPWEFPPEDEVWTDCKLERKHHRGMISLVVTASDGKTLTIDHRIWQPEESRLGKERFAALKEGRLRATITVQMGSEPEFKEFNGFTIVGD